MIIEDDPYFWLYYGDAPRARSLFSLEAEVNGEVGRVVRLDSLSKIISSGMRTGWITAPAAICDQVDLITASTNMQSSSTTQAIVLALFNRWGISGFEEHCARCVRQLWARLTEQRRRVLPRAKGRLRRGGASPSRRPRQLGHARLRDVPLVRALRRWFSTCRPQLELAWLRRASDAELTRYRIQLLGIAAPGEEADAYAVIAEKAVEKGIVAVPGTAFMPGGGKSGFVRTSFSLVSDADADEAMRRLREVILDAQAAVQSAPPPGR